MLFNKALPSKWVWRFAQEENSLRRQVIVEKYGIWKGGWCSKDTRVPY